MIPLDVSTHLTASADIPAVGRRARTTHVACVAPVSQPPLADADSGHDQQRCDRDLYIRELYAGGSLRGDLFAVQLAQLKFFTDPVVKQALPGLLEETSRDTHLGSQFFDEFVGPRRESTVRALHRAEQRGEIEAGFDPEWICDLLTGPLLMRCFVPTGPIDENLAHQTVDAALAALRG